MIVWLHLLIRRNLHAKSGNTVSAQSYTLLMSTGSEQQPLNLAVIALIRCQERPKSGRFSAQIVGRLYPKRRKIALIIPLVKSEFLACT